MRESNFAFPAQNRASVCITSQLYDRRALDTNSPLPLFNSLTHLTYLTSTSPRIREIMTMDGGLERLVRILQDFCICPPPPENPALFYGLQPPSTPAPKLVPTLIPKSVDKHAAYRFSLAFQCVVNIGVRGNESIRSRVVQAGTLEVVGCILEAWLASKGFAVGPNAVGSGMPRETREQRLARRQAQSEARQREQAAQLARALQRQVTVERLRAERAALLHQEDDSMETEPTTTEVLQTVSREDTSNETSTNVTPLGTSTPTGTVVIPGRDRSGTIIARPVWDQAPPPGASTSHHRRNHRTTSARLAVPPSSEGPSTANSTDTSRPETETEDDGDVDMDDSVRESDAPSISGASTPERRNPSPDAAAAVRQNTATHSRRAVGIVSDNTPTPAGASMDMNTDAHIIINDQVNGVEGAGGVEDGIVSLDANDDFAMGAPPGAPGAIDGPPAIAEPHVTGGERTPRAGPVNLPGNIPIMITPAQNNTLRVTGGETGGNPTAIRIARAATNPQATNATNTTATGAGNRHHHHHHHHGHDLESGPYRDEDVLLSLQLLAYLSKYPHVRQAFYKPRVSFHPAAAQQQPSDVKYPGPNRSKVSVPPSASTSGSTSASGGVSTPAPKESNNPFLKAFATATGRGKEKERASVPSTMSTSSSTSTITGPSTSGSNTPATPRMTNVFSLVERFTYRPSSSEVDSPNPPPTLPPEIQYWAGVIMRNACRKDDSRGGIRQCANMMCGKWESFPREFAKCRRCRKAKYCGKECQSTAWSEGHRFWCSAKDPDDDGEHHGAQGGDGTRSRANTTNNPNTGAENGGTTTATVVAGGASATPTITARSERRAERERERQVRALAAETRMLEQYGRTITRTTAGMQTQTNEASASTAAVAGPSNTEVQGGRMHWAPSLLNMRRPRPREDGQQGDSVESSRALIERAVQLVNPRRRAVENAAGGSNNVATATMDIEIPPDVRRQVMQLLQGSRRQPAATDVPTITISPESGPSRRQDDGDGDDDMVLG
ncbi:MYND-type zinc finger protein samB [Abortiporus biennis]